MRTVQRSLIEEVLTQVPVWIPKGVTELQDTLTCMQKSGQCMGLTRRQATGTGLQECLECLGQWGMGRMEFPRPPIEVYVGLKELNHHSLLMNID